GPLPLSATKRSARKPSRLFFLVTRRRPVNPRLPAVPRGEPRFAREGHPRLIAISAHNRCVAFFRAVASPVALYLSSLESLFPIRFMSRRSFVRHPSIARLYAVIPIVRTGKIRPIVSDF